MVTLNLFEKKSHVVDCSRAYSTNLTVRCKNGEWLWIELPSYSIDEVCITAVLPKVEEVGK